MSNEVLLRIEGASYVSNKEKHNDYLWFHPYVAKKRFINLYSNGKFEKVFKIGELNNIALEVMLSKNGC